MENDAYQDENQQEFPEGQLIDDNVGQDEGHDSTENQETNWEESAKYFQSEKDKLSTENEQLRKYEKVGQLLESRPDLVQNLMGQLQGSGQPQQPQNVEMSQDEFDPWEAFNDPKSKSYQYREQQDDERIDARVEQRLGGIQKQMGQAQLQNQVVNEGLVTKDELPQFMDFVNKHPAEYGLANVVKMYRAVNADNLAAQAPNPLDQVRQNQQAPTPAGILAGEQPKRKSELDDIWDRVVDAGKRSDVF
tara:strand:+ start:264 stop:1007 length:744 start_codon:yes stop_codon:yes gene_type:complete